MQNIASLFLSDLTQTFLANNADKNQGESKKPWMWCMRGADSRQMENKTKRDSWGTGVNEEMKILSWGFWVGLGKATNFKIKLSMVS